MATARAQLHAELVEILTGDGENKKAVLDQTIKRYRIQYKKAGQESGRTAREIVLERLLAVLETPVDDVMHTVAHMLDDYRMQAKVAGSGRKRSAKKKAADLASADGGAAGETDSAPAPNASATPSEPPVSPSVPAAVNPAARQRRARAAQKASRSECPKCHSMGVVLARSYATDEYYSCIYCGWQGFKPAEALDQEDSLAARLLGIYSGAPPSESEEQ